MTKKTTPAPRRAGTAKRDRSLRELRVMRQLMQIRKSDPARFSELMDLLAELAVRPHAKKK